jgi:hypothetical protein
MTDESLGAMSVFRQTHAFKYIHVTGLVGKSETLVRVSVHPNNGRNMGI